MAPAPVSCEGQTHLCRAWLSPCHGLQNLEGFRLLAEIHGPSQLDGISPSPSQPFILTHATRCSGTTCGFSRLSLWLTPSSPSAMFSPQAGPPFRAPCLKLSPASSAYALASSLKGTLLPLPTFTPALALTLNNSCAAFFVSLCFGFSS